MDRKGTKAGFSPASRPKRSRFHGNQYTVEEDVHRARDYRAREISTLRFRVLLKLLLFFFFFSSDDLLKRCFRSKTRALGVKNC